MKKIYILSLVTMALLFGGCQKISDWMEKQDTGDLQFEDIWQDVNYVEGWLNNNLGAYPGLGWVFGGEPLWSFTDEGWSSLDGTGGSSYRVYSGNFSSTSGWPGARNLYGPMLVRIRNLNMFLHYIVLPETPVQNEASRRRMIADAYVARAYYMFELFKEYGPLYLYNEDGTNILLQEFIKESAGTDIRAFVVGNQVVASMQRASLDDDFRSNLHQGGQGTPIKLTAEEKKVALKAARAMGLHICGVDLMRSARGPLVLEVNASPGFGIEKVTGKDVASKIIEYIELNAPRHNGKDRVGA